jgi:phage shock protein PspC (stress-responsive transcriptional regulator)
MTTSGTDIPLPSPEAAPRELRRPRDNRMLAGVAAGLAEYFGMRPAIYRIAFAALALVGGAGILLYVVAALVIPAEGAQESIAEDFLRRHRDRPALLVGLGIVGVIAISIVSSPGRDWGWPLLGPLSFVLLLALAALALAEVSKRDRDADAGPPGTRPERRPSLFLPGLGLLLAGGGFLVLLDVLDVVDLRLDVALAVGVVLVGVLIAVGAAYRRVTGLVLLGLLLAAALAVGSLASLGHGPTGERIYTPASIAGVRDEYDVRMGRLELDLTDVDFPAGATRVELDAGIGEIVVVVPEGVTVDARADAGAGDISVFGRHDDGFDVERHVVDRSVGSGARLFVDAHVGLGHIEIRRSESG